MTYEKRYMLYSYTSQVKREIVKTAVRHWNAFIAIILSSMVEKFLYLWKGFKI